MLPKFSDGDYIIALKRRAKTYAPGDVVLVQHPRYQQIIKRIHIVDTLGFFWLKGDGINSVSLEQMGPIKPCQVIAKLLYHIQAQDSAAP